jgi:hypothetical protein
MDRLYFQGWNTCKNVPKKPGYIPQGFEKGLLIVMNLRDEERVNR